MGAIFNVFPLILIPVLTYNIWAFGSTAANNNADVVRAHGGTVVLEHSEPGRTTFAVRLPIEPVVDVSTPRRTEAAAARVTGTAASH